MLKGMIRGVLAATVACVFGLTMISAHADTGVAFTTAAGSTLKSLPRDTSGSPLGDSITGTATDETAVGGVHLEISGPFIPNPNDPMGPTVPVDNFQADADMTCNVDATECTWSYVLPFVMLPGNYTATATAVDFEENTATASIDLTII